MILLWLATAAGGQQAGTPADAPHPRSALVIGNSQYEHLPHLDACKHDAEVMAATFRKLGIAVEGDGPLLDLTADQMDAAIARFARGLSHDSEAYIYYSGHGAQIAGANYLLPVNFDAQYENQARRAAVSLDALLETLEKTDSRLRVVILDACRDPGDFLPGEPALKGASHPKGLSEQRVDAPETLVCFATKHGSAALADDNSSYYSRVLAEEMLKPGRIDDVLRAVARRVYTETDKKQLPFTYGSLLQDHYFLASTTPLTNTLPPAEPVPPPPPTPKPAKPEPEPPKAEPVAPHQAGTAIAKATKRKPFVNSLGMEFVPVPGTKVLFCRTDVRVGDFRRYVTETGFHQVPGAMVLKPKTFTPTWFFTAWEADYGVTWDAPGFKQTDDHAVVCVNCYEAQAFCAWLSAKEGHTYRLPTDAEWTAAVGPDLYPWGKEWPPPKNSGNYADECFGKALPGGGWPQFLGNDGFARTSPVGRFQENRLGLYDMSGEVWQWCEDDYHASMMDPAVLAAIPALRNEKGEDGGPLRVIRGGSWAFCDPIFLRSAVRLAAPPVGRSDQNGFRCVLVVSGK